MLTSAVFVVALAVGTGDVPPGTPEAKVEAIQQFVNEYHRSPAPERVAEMVRALVEDKLIDQPQFNNPSSKGMENIGCAFGYMVRRRRPR